MSKKKSQAEKIAAAERGMQLATSPAVLGEVQKAIDANEAASTVPTVTLVEGENKSQAIRRLTAEGLTTGQIAKALGIRYQHVYNVQKRPLKGRGTDTQSA